MENRTQSTLNTEALHHLAGLLEAGNHLQMALIHLCFEGKPRYGRNVRQTGRQIELLKAGIAARFRLEKKVMFPLLLQNVPQFEPVLALLQADHAEFEQRFCTFRRTFARFQSRMPPHPFFEALREQGNYLVHLLRHHIHTQNQLFQAVMVELSPSARTGFNRRVKAWLEVRQRSKK